jgi:hypothetical protein
LNKNINNASWVLALPDGLEEARTLSILEKNFHKIVKAYLGKLFQAKHTYWRQRATIRFVKFGDENIKVFHVMATHSNRKKYISQLFLPQGECLTNHAAKPDALWESFKERLGVLEFSKIHFQSGDLFQPVTLPSLDSNFSQEEIDLALSDMPP